VDLIPVHKPIEIKISGERYLVEAGDVILVGGNENALMEAVDIESDGYLYSLPKGTQIVVLEGFWDTLKSIPGNALSALKDVGASAFKKLYDLTVDFDKKISGLLSALRDRSQEPEITRDEALSKFYQKLDDYDKLVFLGNLMLKVRKGEKEQYNRLMLNGTLDKYIEDVLSHINKHDPEFAKSLTKFRLMNSPTNFILKVLGGDGIDEPTEKMSKLIAIYSDNKSGDLYVPSHATREDIAHANKQGNVRKFDLGGDSQIDKELQKKIDSGQYRKIIKGKDGGWVFEPNKDRNAG
jgi:hypothetical protein